MPQTVKRWVATKVIHNGQARGLCQSAQGRYTYATEAEAQAWIDAVRESPQNDQLRIKLALGDDPSRAKPMLIDCYAEHFDPCRCYFNLEHEPDFNI